MAIGTEIVLLPDIGFAVIHFAGAALGVFLAWKAMSWKDQFKGLAPFYGFYAVAELLFVSAHLGIIDLYSSHQIGEVLMFLGALAVASAVWKIKEA